MRRLVLLFIVFAIELSVLSLFVDGQALLARSTLMDRVIGAWGMTALHFAVAFVALGATFTYLRRRAALGVFDQEVAIQPVRLWLALLHLALFGGLLVIGQRLYATPASGAGMAGLFVALGVAVLFSGLASVAPLRRIGLFAASAGIVWIYAAAAAVGATLMTAGWRMLWKPASLVTYRLVQWILRPLVGQLVVDPVRLRVATARFGVIISPECSGLEGVGLLLLFSAVWLWLYRKECRFPHALLLLPVSVAALFLLNSVRIAALVLIGNAGARQIAAEGFHSQAGWIAFNGVAFGLCIAAGRVPWIMQAGVNPDVSDCETPATANIVAVYLGPFLAILAAGMLARALTGGFEWLYPLRFVAACAVFWAYRREYRGMKWHFTWRGPAMGLLVFGIWIGLEWLRAGGLKEHIPEALRLGSGFARWGWIAVRVLTAVAAVPVAEEMAFRGYLMRRLVAEDFEKRSLLHFPLWALVVSAVLFGAMHGAQWLAGTVAGALYALVYIRKGQLGEAVAAHAVTNGLIAAAVLGLGYWSLW